MLSQGKNIEELEKGMEECVGFSNEPSMERLGSRLGMTFTVSLRSLTRKLILSNEFFYVLQGV